MGLEGKARRLDQVLGCEMCKNKDLRICAAEKISVNIGVNYIPGGSKGCLLED